MEYRELIIIIFMGLLISLVPPAYQRLRKEKRGKEETIDRVNDLTDLLREASEVIVKIEAEIDERSAALKKLKRDADRYSKLIEITKPEVEVLAGLLRDELVSAGKRSFLTGFVINFIFFVLGIILTVIVPEISK